MKLIVGARFFYRQKKIELVIKSPASAGFFYMPFDVFV
jgi:hypothetical protein